MTGRGPGRVHPPHVGVRVLAPVRGVVVAVHKGLIPEVTIELDDGTTKRYRRSLVYTDDLQHRITRCVDCGQWVHRTRVDNHICT